MWNNDPFVCFGTTSISVQGLLPSLCSGITPIWCRGLNLPQLSAKPVPSLLIVLSLWPVILYLKAYFHPCFRTISCLNIIMAHLVEGQGHPVRRLILELEQEKKRKSRKRKNLISKISHDHMPTIPEASLAYKHPFQENLSIHTHKKKLKREKIDQQKTAVPKKIAFPDK